MNANAELSIHPAAAGAGAGDAGRILVEAAEWQAARGLQGWNPALFTPEWLERHAAAGELFLARLRGEPAATMLLQDEDPLFWPDAPAGESLFLHKLAVSRAFAGRGVALEMIGFAAREAARRGRAYLRLDCARREALARLYEGAGFVRRGERVIERRDESRPGRFEAYLYELRVAPGAD